MTSDHGPSSGRTPRLQIPVVSTTAGILIILAGMALSYWEVSLATLFFIVGIAATIRGNVAEGTRTRLLRVCNEIITIRPDLTALSTAEIALDTVIDYRMLSAGDIRTIQRSRRYFLNAIVRHTTGKSAKEVARSRSDFILEVSNRGSRAILDHEAIVEEHSPAYLEKMGKVYDLLHSLLLLPENGGGAEVEEERHRLAVALDRNLNEARRQKMRD